MTLQSDSKIVCQFLIVWLSILGKNAVEVGCTLLVSQSMGPCLLGVFYYHAGRMISDIIEFCIVKLFFLFVIKHVGENMFSAV